MQQGKWMERIRWICWLNGVQKRTFYETVLIWGIRRMIMAEKVRDLRSALEGCGKSAGQISEKYLSRSSRWRSLPEFTAMSARAER